MQSLYQLSTLVKFLSLCAGFPQKLICGKSLGDLVTMEKHSVYTRLSETLRYQIHKSAIVPLQDIKNIIDMYSAIAKMSAGL